MTTFSSERKLWLGDFHPDLEHAFAARLRELAPGGDARGLLVVVPNRLLASHLRRRAAELGTPTYGLEPKALEDLIAELARPLLERDGRRLIPSHLFAAVLEHLLRGERRRIFASPGMVRALAGTVRDLRDAGIAPDALEAAVESELGDASRPREAARLYSAYLRGLDKRRLVDAAALTELAAAAARGGDTVATHLVVYGVYDLVGRQREFLESLLGERTADVFLPWREGPALEFAEPLRVWFEARGFRSSGAPAIEGGDRLAHLRRFLFASEPAPAPPPDDSLRLLSVPEPARELTEVLREDLASRSSGAAGTTGILVRRSDEAARDAAGVEKRTGLRLHLPGGEPWRRRPAGAVAAVLLRIATDLRGEDGGPSLERGRVEELLGTGALARDIFPAGARPGRWTQVLRRQGLLGRLDAWDRLVARHKGGQIPLSLDPSDVPFVALAVEETDSRLRRELPSIATFVERLLADARSLGETGGGWRGIAGRWREVMRRWLEPGEEAEALAEALVDLERLEGILPARWPAIETALDALLDSPAGGRGRLGESPTVADLLIARGVTFDHVALPRLVERVVPRRAREDPVLLDDERSAINRRLPGDATLPLKLASAAAEERFLFRLGIGSARRSLLLSWPRRDAGGRRLVPSTYLLAVGRALAGRETGFAALWTGADASDGERLGLTEVALDSSALVDRLVLHPAERDLQAIAKVARTGAGDLTWLRRAHPGLEASLRAELARSGWRDRQRLTVWDGLVDPTLAEAWLAARSAPEAGLNLSASALETYVRCSFQFWNRYVLRLETEPPSETRLELDALESGALYHELLAELYRRLEREALLPLDASRLEAARQRLGELFEELRRDPPWIAHEMPPALWALWRERAAADFDVLLERDAADSTSGWRPARFELPFGGADDPVVVEVGAERLTTRGAIDRLDVRTGGGVRVVDYKTGKLKTEHTPDPPALQGRLQAPLYARVVEELRASGRLPEASGPVSALYLGVQAGSGYRRVEWTPEALADAAPELERVLAGIRSGITKGEFFQVERDHLCTLCEFTDICGPGRQSRLAAKAADERVGSAAAWREPAS